MSKAELLSWFDDAISEAREDHEPPAIVEWLQEGRALAVASVGEQVKVETFTANRFQIWVDDPKQGHRLECIYGADLPVRITVAPRV